MARCASLVIAGAGIVYLASLLLNISAGFPMPPTGATRTIASLSVLGSAPAFLVLAYRFRLAGPPRLARLAVGLTAVFAIIAVANRVIQLIVLPLTPQAVSARLDLYIPYSLGQNLEMFGWGLVFGAAALTVAIGMLERGEARVPGRLLQAAGLMGLLAWLIYTVAAIGALPHWIGGVGVAAGGAAWALLWPLSAALFAMTHDSSIPIAATPSA